MRRIISYSLWGNSRLYLEGAIENIEYAAKYYPGWICRFYVASNCPAICILKALKCEVVEMPPWQGIDRTKEDWKWQKEHAGMMWRYLAIDELEQDDCVIFRDADSRVSKREADYVNIWLQSDYFAHAFYENPTHYNGGFQGGLWGIRSRCNIMMKESIENWIEYYKTVNHDYIFIDLCFNQSVLLPILNSSLMRFGCGTSRPLPELKDGENPIGWVERDDWRNETFQPYTYWLSHGVFNQMLKNRIEENEENE